MIPQELDERSGIRHVDGAGTSTEYWYSRYQATAKGESSRSGSSTCTARGGGKVQPSRTLLPKSAKADSERQQHPDSFLSRENSPLLLTSGIATARTTSECCAPCIVSFAPMEVVLPVSHNHRLSALASRSSPNHQMFLLHIPRWPDGP